MDPTTTNDSTTNRARSRSGGHRADGPMPEDRDFWGWLDNYLTGIIGIALLGGQITFTVLVSEIADPAQTVAPPRAPTFGRETVRTFIAVAWLLFTTLMGISVFVKILLSDPRERGWLVRRLGAGRFRAGYAALTLLLNALSIVPFLFLALAATAYVPVVGWLGTALVAVYTVVVGVSWLVLDSGGIR